MAVDTPSRRASAMVSSGLPLVLPLPLPDGDIDFGDRRHLSRLYSGLAAPAVQAPLGAVQRIGAGIVASTGRSAPAILSSKQSAGDNVLSSVQRITSSTE